MVFRSENECNSGGHLRYACRHQFEPEGIRKRIQSKDSGEVSETAEEKQGQDIYIIDAYG